MKALTGAAMAVMVAGLVGCNATDSSQSSSAGATASSGGAKTDLVHCYDVNICGGHNDCKTASNACAGQASCKGSGFVGMPAKACADVGGKQKDDWVGSVAKADLVHCHDVNICGGHNDCKTANNACAAQASCKGTGFVNMPAKACKDIGGKVGS
ncbi:BufA2 family periplasmic bufferin-type metallophore [Pseudoalteromonas luteoviolacea]|uniref:Lipoprotein n=1 Tax=Pseudoalteromonas luteoviolacea S4054 TaxID=1129367 RepID=A0A0F6AHP7_9GAMM|nr:hypothetical protein [Pseudoalteromonas luteoviolacea]AOT11060.1 hypothetical protein S4054249_24815 [Pseudoalteromonas luteoviolacea]AOT15776.1 hypothetical protein S40542_23695 [Pseudoalteromonas luteoviolacea]AOT20881.1 hypothetical protein S4054_24735 [Pseudoalteromonas luteoviolacea]KKE85742.1 hypothetical protein N479_24620 [Pseudoalteromonas luteoviolacea S4054]KZN71101.1 hypothetical protein N481_19675 [Pseudoalteromonas luteoviolacea S4047-1]